MLLNFAMQTGPAIVGDHPARPRRRSRRRRACPMYRQRPQEVLHAAHSAACMHYERGSKKRTGIDQPVSQRQPWKSQCRCHQPLLTYRVETAMVLCSSLRRKRSRRTSFVTCRRLDTPGRCGMVGDPALDRARVHQDGADISARPLAPKEAALVRVKPFTGRAAGATSLVTGRSPSLTATTRPSRAACRAIRAIPSQPHREAHGRLS
jgi:hypothetical protein